MPKKIAFALLLVVVVACQPVIVMPIFADCPPMAVAKELRVDWLFRLDEQNEGLAQAWYATNTDISDLPVIQAGMAWEQQGFEYDGVAWYYQELTLIKPQVLFLADIDDSATLWVNGVQTATLSLETQTAITVNLESGDNLLVVRVVDNGGYGGIKSVPRLADSATLAIDNRHYAPMMAKQYPTVPFPSWTQGKPMAWTMTGGLEQADEALVSIDGAVAPYAEAPITEVWLYNASQNRLLDAGSFAPIFSLVGDAPIPQWEWTAERNADSDADNVSVRQVLFFDETDGVVRSRIWVNHASSDDWQVLLATRNLGVNYAVHPIQSLANYEGEGGVMHQWLNQKPFLVVNRVPQKQWAGDLPILVETLREGREWEYVQRDCTDGQLASVLRYDLPKNQETIVDVAFAGKDATDFPTITADTGKRLDESRQFWQAQTRQAVIQVPDGRVQASLTASLGYLLLASDPDGPHPGPLAHNAIWTRDGAYMGLALLMAGHSEVAKRYVDAIFAGQSSAGRVPPIQGENVPWKNDEWDAQGQAIFLVTQIYRFTGDSAFLEKWYPNIKKAAEYIIALRQKNKASDNLALRGLLPASLSAEDLGEGEQHYYWDNFWAIAGLREMAFVGDVLGKNDDSRRYALEADDLQIAILDSITQVMGDNPPYIPVSVETPENSGMARGSVPTLFPYGVFSAQDELIKRSFDEYYTRWIAPYNGGYMHREGQFWTYGGIELAHAYLRLGRGDVLHQILGWTLSHQTLPNAYAWAEQVSPSNFGFTGGDMPHAWMSASYYSLIREMLVLEENNAIALFKGASGNWFWADNSIRLENLPTHFGTLNVTTTSTIIEQDGRWQGTLTIELSGGQPPNGFYWDIGQVPTRIEGATLDGNRLLIDPQTERVVLDF
jgi:hypothetical protein